MHILDFNHVLGFSSLRGVPGFGILQRDPLTSMSGARTESTVNVCLSFALRGTHSKVYQLARHSLAIGSKMQFKTQSI